MKLRILSVLILLSLLLSLAGCGEQAAPTAPPTATQVALAPTATTAPTATPLPPTATPQPTAMPEPTATPEPSPTKAPAPATLATFEEAACPFDLPAGQVEGQSIECGYLLVPEDRADPDSPSIRLAVAIVHPAGGATEPDPILYLSGGPGGSALEFLYLTFSKLEPALSANRDLILFDQRGVGRSEPALDCPAMIELGLELLDDELDGQVLTEEDAYDLVLETLNACYGDLSQVANLSAYNSVANAADVNDLRLALGYEQVNLWGTSYGTRLALEVMRDYPEGLRSVILDSVYPPDVNLYLESPANLDRAFTVFFEGCAQDEACNAAYPDLRAVFFDTVDRLNENPASIEVTNPFTRETYQAMLHGDDLLGLLFQLLYETEAIPSLPQLIDDASEGNYTMIGMILGSLLAQQEAMSIGMQFSVQCNEELGFGTLDEFRAAVAEYPDLAEIFGDSVVGALAFQVCAAWDSGQADALENQAVTSDVPTLVMAGEYDPITPPSWALRAAETLDNSYVFEYPGVGHGASIVEGCPIDMMVAFLDDPSSPPDDACIAEMDGPRFTVPGGSQAVEMEPFSSEIFGFQGMIPAGWEEVSPGAYARGDSALDVATILIQAAPMGADMLLGLLSSQLGLSAPPESIGEREANGLTWTLYAVEIQTIPVDLALAESEGVSFIVLLQSDPDEHDALYEAVFLPAIDALVPLE